MLRYARTSFSRQARVAAVAVIMALTCFPAHAIAEDDIDADGFMAFQDICLRDQGQFDYAKEVAGDMMTAPEPQRSLLLDNREGEIWISSAHPFIAMKVLKDGGCGITMKPVREDYLNGFLGAIPGQNIVDKQAVGDSWSRWYLINVNGLKGVLVAGLLDLNEERSADLRYLPSQLVLTDERAGDFLLLDAAKFEMVRSRLRDQ